MHEAAHHKAALLENPIEVSGAVEHLHLVTDLDGRTHHAVGREHALPRPHGP